MNKQKTTPNINNADEQLVQQFISQHAIGTILDNGFTQRVCGEVARQSVAYRQSHRAAIRAKKLNAAWTALCCLVAIVYVTHIDIAHQATLAAHLTASQFTTAAQRLCHELPSLFTIIISLITLVYITLYNIIGETRQKWSNQFIAGHETYGQPSAQKASTDNLPA